MEPQLGIYLRDMVKASFEALRDDFGATLEWVASAPEDAERGQRPSMFLLYADLGDAYFHTRLLDRVTWTINDLEGAAFAEVAEAEFGHWVRRLDGLELGYPAFEEEFVDDMERSLAYFHAHLQSILSVESSGPVFDLLLNERDVLGYAKMFLDVRKIRGYVVPVEPEDLAHRLRREDIPLRLWYERLAERFQYSESSLSIPEDFWWRRISAGVLLHRS